MSHEIEPCSCAESQHYLAALNEIVQVLTNDSPQPLALDAKIVVEVAIRARHLVDFSTVRARVHVRHSTTGEDCYLCGQPVDLTLSCWITKHGVAHLECHQLATETVLVATVSDDQMRK